ncbi:MAG: hypothetical protein WBJ36_00680 [Tenuifilum sp.]|uniref:hypothetical protein n=2 Tax=Tenuifilum sp. TaxID=2760880 RepID=UPI002CB8EA6C|nr:hypothetical protein [Tenuifilum sp.]
MRNFISFIAIVTILTLSINPSNAQGITVKIVTPNNKTDFCANQTITLVAQTDMGTDDGINLKWEGDLSIVEKNLGNILILKPNSKGIYTFTVFLKDNEGNEASSSVTISVNPIFKPILKLKNNKVEIETKGNFSGCSLKYYIGNQMVNEDAFKNAKQPGKYYVLTTSPDGCSASSNIIEIQ